MKKCDNGLDRVELSGQFSRDYGHTYRVVMRDHAGSVIRGQGGLDEDEAIRLAAEWEDEV